MIRIGGELLPRSIAADFVESLDPLRSDENKIPRSLKIMFFAGRVFQVFWLSCRPSASRRCRVADYFAETEENVLLGQTNYEGDFFE